MAAATRAATDSLVRITAPCDGAILPVTAVVGTQWGDEGKGKAIDYLCAAGDYTHVARCAGGPNAAHTIVVADPAGGAAKRCMVRLVPSGALHPDIVCVIGHGVVVDVGMLVDEMTALGRDHGMRWRQRMHVSDRAHVLLDLHKALDAHGEREAASRGAAVGTTRRGVGPCYADKVARRGVRVGDLAHRDRFVRRVRGLFAYHASAHPAAVVEVLATLGLVSSATATNGINDDDVGTTTLSALTDTVLDAAAEAYAVRYVDGYYDTTLRGLVCDTINLVAEAICGGGRVLVECSQATMLDIDHGSYPHVTSSSTTAAGAAAGLGVAPRLVGAVGVAKAYVTRVISHPDARAGCPFPTRLPDLHVASDSGIAHLTAQAAAAGTLSSADLPAEVVGVLGVPPGVFWDSADLASARAMSVIGREMDGSGRPRAVGWFDAVIVRRACLVSGFDTLVLNKIDVLSGLAVIKIAVAYRMADGAVVDSLPEDLADVVEPVYRHLTGWHEDVGACRTFDDLPVAARVFVRAIEETIGCRVGWVGVGPARHQMLVVPPTLMTSTTA
ncbi:2-aminooxy adenylosuccinate synthetase [Pandoravirus inopinatum]|uniref:Adenylosuccinate synthetase n=1 Tax=Pandoravirus inopinatum TaxID=1605721 RepID=A0A0B5J049_9VIRU|nr:2-aminooxy adenylosuccinate synthetase [Pandoravirus inopinatum]AJF96814.1 adenylosuccinate synthetase [Pandoravirus inopinatum]